MCTFYCPLLCSMKGYICDTDRVVSCAICDLWLYVFVIIICTFSWSSMIYKSSICHLELFCECTKIYDLCIWIKPHVTLFLYAAIKLYVWTFGVPNIRNVEKNAYLIRQYKAIKTSILFKHLYVLIAGSQQDSNLIVWGEVLVVLFHDKSSVYVMISFRLDLGPRWTWNVTFSDTFKQNFYMTVTSWNQCWFQWHVSASRLQKRRNTEARSTTFTNNCVWRKIKLCWIIKYIFTAKLCSLKWIARTWNSFSRSLIILITPKALTVTTF